MAQQIALECLDNTIKAADILGGVSAGIITEDDYNLLKDRLENMEKRTMMMLFVTGGGVLLVLFMSMTIMMGI